MPRNFFRRIVARLRRRGLETELEEEMLHHLELRTRALMDEGLDPDEARATARRQFGNVTVLREQSREAWSFPALDDVAGDLRFGARTLRRHPLFSTVAIVSVAIAVGASTAVFTIMNAALFRPLSADSEVHRIFTSNRDGGAFGRSSYAEYQAVAERRDVFASTCAMMPLRVNVRAEGRGSRPYSGQIATAECLSLLQLRASFGAPYTADDSTPRVVVSDRLWQRELGANPDAIGKSLLVNDVSATIVGVAPRGFGGTSFEAGADFWIPPATAAPILSAAGLAGPAPRMFTVLTRLAPGVSTDAADATLAVVARRLALENPAAWTESPGRSRRFTILEETAARFASTEGAAWLLIVSVLAIIAALVAVACLNVATMMLALGVSRTREISIRLALGASNLRVLRQLVTECVTLGAAGSVLGLALFYVTRELAMANLPVSLPVFDTAIDWRVIAVVAALGLVTPLIFGLVPALHALRLAIGESIKSGSGAASPSSGGRVRRTLIVLQVAASTALLLVSALFARALIDDRGTSPGFSTGTIAAIEVDTEFAGTAEDVLRQSMRRLIGLAASVEGADDVVAAGVVPLTGSAIGFLLRADSDPADLTRTVDGNVVGSGYFGLFGVAVLAGREFEERDTAGSPRTAIVNQALARALWGTPDAVGRWIVRRNDERVLVVGVVADTRYRTLSGSPEPLLYLPIEQHPRSRAVIHARVRHALVVEELARALREMDGRIIVDRTGTIAQWLDEARAPELYLQWGGAAAGIGQLALAVTGLWALVTYSVGRRTAEMGIRLALGASARSLVALTLRPAVLLIVVGVLLGSVAGLIGGTILRASTSGFGPLDAAMILPVGVLLVIVAGISAWLPARRVARIDPVTALRHE